MYTGPGYMLANELRGLRGQIQSTCSMNPSGQDCLGLQQKHEEALLRYKMLLTGVPESCRAQLPDPLSL
jgi:hypothetical protein